MIPNLPNYVSLIFGFTTLITFYLLYHSLKATSLKADRLNLVVLLLLGWLLLQASLGYSGFYLAHLDSGPPRFFLAVLPTLLVILAIFSTQKGRALIDELPLLPLTYLHTVRIPVELVLYWLFLQTAIPEVMTFAGRNFDIIAGITAPFIAYFGLQQKKLSRKLLLVWNILCLGLLLNIVALAVLSLPSPFQQIAFEQPNMAVLHFPFTWLPSFIVPVVLFSHLVSIRRLFRAER